MIILEDTEKTFDWIQNIFLITNSWQIVNRIDLIKDIYEKLTDNIIFNGARLKTWKIPCRACFWISSSCLDCKANYASLWLFNRLGSHNASLHGKD